MSGQSHRRTSSSATSSRQPPSRQDDIQCYSGKNILRLVRRVEKCNNNNEGREELNDLLNGYLQHVSRRGLLMGNVQLADKILESGMKSSSNLPSGGKKENKGKKNSKNNQDWNLDGEVSAANSGGVGEDSQLLLMALVRLVGGNHELSTPRKDMFAKDLTISSLGVCIAILQHFLSNKATRSSSCSQCEEELLGGVVRGLLTGVARTLSSILPEISTVLHMMSVEDVQLVDSGFHLAALSVCMFGSKLSRNRALLQQLKSLVWRCMGLPNKGLHPSASRLLAALPLAGTDNKPASIGWNEAMVDSVGALCFIFGSLAPKKLNANSKQVLKRGAGQLSEISSKICSAWIDRVKETEGVDVRADWSANFVSAQCKSIQALCKAESFVGHESTVMSEFVFPISTVLELVSVMVSFPSLAESIYFAKKRLRHELVEDGFLTPHAMVQIANEIKLEGLELLRTVVKCVGRPALLPFGRWIAKIAESALSTSCSTLVLQALEANHAITFGGKRQQQKWLQTSVELRMHSISMFDDVVSTLGSNLVVSAKSSSDRQGHIEKGVSLVAGCLMEQLLGNQEDTRNWGSVRERSLLIIASIDCLRNILLACGGFLRFKTRSLIDSVIKTCIDNNIILFRDDQVIASLLRLLSACLNTPWPDGGTTSLMHVIRRVAQSFVSHHDRIIALEASVCLNQLSSMNYPRAPPILQVTRSVGCESGGHREADSILRDLQDAKQAADNAEAEEAEAKRKAATSKESKRKREAANKEETEDNDKKLKGDALSGVRNDKASDIRDSVVKVKGAHTPPTGPSDAEFVDPLNDANPTSTEAATKDPEENHDVITNDVIPVKQASTIQQQEIDIAQEGSDDDMDLMPGIVDTEPDYEEDE